MHALNDNTASPRFEQAADPTHPPARNLVTTWARGRRQITPWAYPRLRALAAVRFTVSVFLVGVAAVLLFHGHDGLAAIPLAGAALNFSIACLDITAARPARR
jgi:hypothetical protein